MSGLIGFPNPVNEKAARSVAAGVVVLSTITLVTGWHWLLILIALGFLARVASGPKLSPLGQLATKVIAPRLGEPVLVPGPPKRFAQAIGATVTSVAAVASLALGWHAVGTVALVIMVVFATLESALGLCVGCKIFSVLMRLGVIPPETCEACNDIWSRPTAAV
ncbi:MAG: DUF4395 domain-containing protein [Solirubrobacteraceae bacterium]|nr:DUF4395 domain-containing protein [Solirubrobacteraceae bacterium]